jgi:nanoRNase/pAp phosphatase (c-di-AMP/oligoRNAs hydrolase)
LIAESHGIEVKIIYSGRLRLRQNLALVKLLGVDIHPYQNKNDLSGFDLAVVFDSGSPSQEVDPAIKAQELPVANVLNLVDFQVREAFGLDDDSRPPCSISTYYAAQMENGLVNLDKGSKTHVAAATGMLFGILSSSGQFVDATEPDYMAASFLSQFRDSELLELLMSQARSKQVLDLIRRALGNRLTIESYSIAGVGYLRSEDRDAIIQAAEFLLTEENIHTAIVYGIMQAEQQREILIGSMKTTKITIYPEEFIRDLFGELISEESDSDINLSGSGFQIPVGFLSGDPSHEYRDLKWKVFDAQVKFKIFEKIGANPDILSV